MYGVFKFCSKHEGFFCDYSVPLFLGAGEEGYHWKELRKTLLTYIVQLIKSWMGCSKNTKEALLLVRSDC